MPLRVSASIACGLGLDMLSSTPCQRHRDIGNGNRHRRLRLVYRHRHPLYSWVAQTGPGNSLRQRLDQVEWVPLDVPDHRLGQLAVVDRLAEIVVGSGDGQIELAAQVDDEGLALLPLMGENPVIA